MSSPLATAVWLGANFWSRAGGPRMWARYDPSVVREELAVLAAHGCNVTRSFCYWPDFMPAPEEMPLYGGQATSDEITAWARLLVQAVRSTGATQPISLGDGAWGVEVSAQDNGYSLRALAPLVDFVGPGEVELGVAAEPLTFEPFGVATISANRGLPATVKRDVLGTAPVVATGEGRDAAV